MDEDMYYETYNEYYRTYEEDYWENYTGYCVLAEDKTSLVAITVFAGLCILWLITASLITLLVVYRAKVERQKKQLIGTLIASLYVGLIGLPSTLLQLHWLEILEEDFRWCLLTFGFGDLGNLMGAVSAALTICTGSLSIKYPLRSHLFEDAENKIVVCQFTFPVIFILILMVVNFSFGPRDFHDCCSWSYLPRWYYLPNTIALFIALTGGYGFAISMMCIARKQAIAVNTIEMATQDPQYLQKRKKRNARQAMVIKLLVLAFTVTWAPLIITILLDDLVETINLGSLFFNWIYFTVVTIGATLPVIYSYAFTDVRYQLKTLIGKLRVRGLT